MRISDWSSDVCSSDLGDGHDRMTALIALCWRDLHRAWGSGALWLPVLFFLLVATAFPFAVGPDAPLLRRAGGGMVWVAAFICSEERSVGKDCVRTCRSRWQQNH